MRTEQTKRFLLPGEPLRLLPIVFMSLFAVTLAADAVIVLQPSLLRPLRHTFQHWAEAGGAVPSWASVFATGVAITGIALAASLLSVFVHGVQKAPYLWLAPIVVGTGAALMARLQVELPVPFSAPGFALLGACAVLGGGAMLRPDAFATRFAAMLVMATPLISLAIGYSQGGSTHMPQAATEFVLLLAMTTFTTAVLAWVTREAPLGDADETGEQLVALLERARTAEARATFAEQQLASAGYGSFAVHSPGYLNDDDALAQMRGASSGDAVLYAAILFLIGGLATGYFAGYAPLQNRIDAQRKVAQTNDEAHVHAIKALRSSFDSERSALQAQLRAAQAAPVQAALAAVPAPAPAEPEVAAAIVKPAPKPAEAKPKPAEAKKAEAKKAEPAKIPATEAPALAKPKLAAAHVARPVRTKKTSAKAKPVAKPADAKAAASSAKSHYDDDALDDDPIGGL
jgi:hypothetical protein